MFVIANATALLMQPNRKRRPVIFASALAAIVAPFLLEWAGLAPPSYAITGGRLVVMNRMLDYTPAAHAIHIGVTLTFVVAIRLYSCNFATRSPAPKSASSWHAWQLRQLVPEAQPDDDLRTSHR